MYKEKTTYNVQVSCFLFSRLEKRSFTKKNKTKKLKISFKILSLQDEEALVLSFVFITFLAGCFLVLELYKNPLQLTDSEKETCKPALVHCLK